MQRSCSAAGSRAWAEGRPAEPRAGGGGVNGGSDEEKRPRGESGEGAGQHPGVPAGRGAGWRGAAGEGSSAPVASPGEGAAPCPWCGARRSCAPLRRARAGAVRRGGGSPSRPAAGFLSTGEAPGRSFGGLKGGTAGVWGRETSPRGAWAALLRGVLGGRPAPSARWGLGGKELSGEGR